MPLTPFQQEVLAMIVANRSELSHFAGGLVLNVPDESARYSNDFDIFHEAEQDLARHSDEDVATLEKAGLTVERVVRGKEWDGPASFRKAVVKRNAESVEIDWAHDSAFRFFPIVEDSRLGWRIHLFDLAINKALALSARTETRDYVDIVELIKHYPLEAICWAACGKDPGFSPLSLLKMMRRFAKVDPVKLNEIRAREIDPIALKMDWIEACDRAEAEMVRLADTRIDMPIGVAFVDAKGEPGWIGSDPDLKNHAPSIRGCWPTIRRPEDEW
jgi:hypothetical protein